MECSAWSIRTPSGQVSSLTPGRRRSWPTRSRVALTDVVVSGPPEAVLRWLWSRASPGGPSAVTVEGPPEAVSELRRRTVTATQ
nr:hypothetical protein [Micromonospora phaseoli]